MTPLEREQRASVLASGQRPRTPLARGKDREVAPDVRRRMIAEAAYFRAEQREFSCECDLHDWLVAEKEVDATIAHGGSFGEQASAAPTAPRRKRAKK